MAAHVRRPSSSSRAAFERLAGRARGPHHPRPHRDRQRHRAARELGDLSENGDYHAAKEQQGQMEGRIRQLESILKNADIVESPCAAAWSSPARSSTHHLRGRRPTTWPSATWSAHIEERARHLDVISPGRPRARPLIGHRAGETVSYQAPNGTCGEDLEGRDRLTDSLLGMADECGTGRAEPAFLPPGRMVELPGRGTTFVRELAGPPRRADGRAAARLDGDGRHQLVLQLYSARPGASGCSPSTTAATGGACARAPLPPRGLRRRRRRARQRLRHQRFIAVGYSMGGPIAQLVWKQHPDASIEGLVLCATARDFSGRPRTGSPS